MTTLIKTATSTLSLDRLSSVDRELLPRAVGNFIDTAITATARATFYNTKAEQEAAIETVHGDLFAIDRGIYTAAMLLPGMSDYNRQAGVVRLMRSARPADALLSAEQESHAVREMIRLLPTQRMLKLFGMLREQRVNNSRTRRLMLSSILGSDKLEFRAVKYRRKLAVALTHAWGRRTAGILRSILAKPCDQRNDKEQRILRRHLHRFANGARVEECVRFVLGDENGLTLRRLAAYRDAKTDFARGSELPFETMEGLRSRFHTDKSSADVLALTRSQLTSGQQINLQRKATKADVEVEFDPAKYDATRLYLYAFEMGLTEAIREELSRKATDVASRMPMQFGHAGILVDVSASMMGHDTQRLRPISVALAVRDLLAATAERATIVSSDGRIAPACELIEPVGDTSLAAGLVSLLQRKPDVVFVLTDGYENAPAGRFSEVVGATRRMGIETPIHQFSPVFAAEAGGLRSLSGAVPGMPISKPEAIGLGVLKALFESDLGRGVAALFGMAKLESTRIEEVHRVS